MGIPYYTLVAGVNGVGKSSFAGVLLSRNNDLGCYIDADKLTVEAGGSRFAGGKRALAKIRDCLTKELSFTQESTLSGQKVWKTVREALQKGFRIRMFYIGLDTLEESQERIRNRVARGGHDIPAADIKRRFGKRFADLFRILPYCEEVYFYDNGNGFVEVARYQNGQLILEGEHYPRWIMELRQFLRME